MAQNNINIKNRKATFDYEILETFTAGIVLTGTEIKSLRQGKAGLTDTYCMVPTTITRRTATANCWSHARN